MYHEPEKFSTQQLHIFKFIASTVAAASAIILIMRMFIKTYNSVHNNSVENIHALRLCEKLSS